MVAFVIPGERLEDVKLFLTAPVMVMNDNPPESISMSYTYHSYWQQRIADIHLKNVDINISLLNE
jgi:hypothetical protein